MRSSQSVNGRTPFGFRFFRERQRAYNLFKLR